MSLFSCAGNRPRHLGVKDGLLAACPARPNCVVSDATDSAHGIPALGLAVAPIDAWSVLPALLESLPRVHIVTLTEDYIHAECRSAFFGFVDDLELHLRAQQNIIAVRSAARLGQSDFGVNRRRVEKLRRLLWERGVIR